jgi:thiosulfate/3-mercaptopyruvate sulfurtransferase
MQFSLKQYAWGAALMGLALGVMPMDSSAAEWANPGLLATPDVVKANAGKPDWVVIDCRDLKDYAEGHIPGAISLGGPCGAVLRDTSNRAFTDVGWYERLLGKVGISNANHVVVYHGDMRTLNDATVAFWILEWLGHDKVYFLNGGIDAWRKGGNRLDTKPEVRAPATFAAKPVKSRLSETNEISDIAAGKIKGVQLIDSRTAAENKGQDIRAVRGGHVPNTTINISHLDTLVKEKNPKTGKMEAVAYLSPDAAAELAKFDRNKRTISYCQTGTRSTLTYLQLRLLGFKDASNWDESWRIYGSTPGTLVADEQWFDFATVNAKIKSLEGKITDLEAALAAAKK